VSDKIRIHLDIDRDLHTRAQKVIPWGSRRILLETILERLVAGLEKEGPILIGAVIGGEYEMVYKPKTPDNEEILQSREGE
tara:strand:- start:1002 stop:1244 length:243 start_codon:yes stop_codon:yes gene_type:complete